MLVKNVYAHGFPTLIFNIYYDYKNDTKDIGYSLK